MKKEIKTIIWDLGNVLINWDPNHLFNQLIKDEEQRTYFLANVCTMDWNENQDAGYPIEKATEELVAKHPEWKANIEAYYGRWVEMLGGPIPGSVDIFRVLKEQTNLKHYALTNWSHELFPTALKLYDFLHWFDGRVVSGEERMRKPEPAFYQILLDRYQLHVDDVIFIDDNLRNVRAAEAMGIRSIHFHSPDQLKQALIKEKILPGQ
jgi:2-haloacid dehalogenase